MKENSMITTAWICLLLVLSLSLVACHSEETTTPPPPPSDKDPQASDSSSSQSTQKNNHSEQNSHDKKFTNHLANETSPYLLQHKHNPVDWYPWGAEALEKAKKEDKPIFLSVGYSTCHWCHVMAHESFENEQVAAILNKYYICIKVDREERPDIDSQYMLATQIMTRRGGWPNSVVLTPDGRPWFAGTYFPRPQFISLLNNLQEAWATQRDEIEKQADQLSDYMRQASTIQSDKTVTELTDKLIDQAVETYQQSYDATNGGFGSAPKFPPHSALAILAYQAQHSADKAKRASAENILAHTLDAMALGGLYDHVGFGFHRYSTDGHWLVPHFEKMLYDNAQLIKAYADGYQLTQSNNYKQTINEVVQWLKREMTDSNGGFYSALDADSDGEEGKFYVWTYDQITNTLGDQEAKLFCKIYGIGKNGNFTDEATGQQSDANIIHLKKSLATWARQLGQNESDLQARLNAMRIKLLEERSTRVRPSLDDKVIAGWNGLMIGSLAYAGHVLDEPEYSQIAEKAARFVLENMVNQKGQLLRTSRKGQAKLPAYLDDYAYLVEGLIELHLATKDKQWLDAAVKLADQMLQQFEDTESGGFYFSSKIHEQLLGRTKNPLGGGNIPDANGVAALALLQLGKLTNNPKYTEAAHRTLIEFATNISRMPTESGSLTLAAMQYFKQTNTKRIAINDSSNELVTASITAISNSVQPEQIVPVNVTLNIADGYHIYAANDGKNILPTTAKAEAGAGYTAQATKYPKPKSIKDPVFDDTLNIYEKAVLITVPIKIASDATGEIEIQISVSWQACDDQQCQLPEKKTLTLKLNVQP